MCQAGIHVLSSVKDCTEVAVECMCNAGGSHGRTGGEPGLNRGQEMKS